MEGVQKPCNCHLADACNDFSFLVLTSLLCHCKMLTIGDAGKGYWVIVLSLQLYAATLKHTT